MEELISRADVEKTVEDNILCYTHSDRPQDPDTECHMAIRIALRMLIKDLKKLPSTQPERIKARWKLAENQRPEDMENGNYLFICSNCGSTDLHSKRVTVSYCWDCGAEMLKEVTE